MAETVTMPKLGFDMAEGTLVRWVKLEGDAVNKGDILAEIETDKATVEVESAFTGVVFRHMVDEGSIVPVGASIAVITAPGETPDVALLEAAGTTKPSTSSDSLKEPVKSGEKVLTVAPMEGQRIKASPLAKKIAQEKNISLASLIGSGPGGRIVRRDVEQAAAEVNAVKNVPAPTAEKPAPAPAVVLPLETWSGGSSERKDEHVPLTKLRTAIARRMVESKQAPHFYVTHEYDMAALMKLRKEVNEFLPEEQRLSVND
ncbi:MAG: 2-oxo acid dehydrogenase subunit E2, partial [Chloroflexi bacterium]|nr:2-oxo acid dehydrogenase subunit E2 [Chloroflexota bacterium]